MTYEKAISHDEQQTFPWPCSSAFSGKPPSALLLECFILFIEDKRISAILFRPRQYAAAR